jgi:thiamine pyrophosphate-dependent acetolactate synthase large subunit-like protein
VGDSLITINRLKYCAGVKKIRIYDWRTGRRRRAVPSNSEMMVSLSGMSGREAIKCSKHSKLVLMLGIEVVIWPTDASVHMGGRLAFCGGYSHGTAWT